MIGICKNEHGWYISKHNKQLGVKYYKTLTEVMPVAYAEEYKSRPKNAEKLEKSMWKSNLIKPICHFGGKVVQEQHCKWLSNTETKAIIRY
jgi:hypothetical protein